MSKKSTENKSATEKSTQRRRFLKGATGAVAATAASSSFPAPALSQGRLQWRLVTTWPKNFPGLGGEVVKAAGGNVVNLPGGEIQPALQSGALDATEWVGPYNDLAFGLYKSAKYYYFPGWHEPGTVLDNFININAWEKLPGYLKSIVESANAAVNQIVLSEFTARNNGALQTLVGKHKVKLLKFPDNVLNGLGKLAGEVMNEIASKDALSREIMDDYLKFRKGAEPRPRNLPSRAAAALQIRLAVQERLRETATITGKPADCLRRLSFAQRKNMFHADHTALQILGHAMIAFLFLYRCFTAMPRFAEHAGRLAKKRVPFPDLSLAIGFGMMLVGGASILFDFYSLIGAGLLIVFTMLANVLYHDFWNHHDDPAERNRALYVFCNNTAVMGGLVLVATL